MTPSSFVPVEMKHTVTKAGRFVLGIVLCLQYLQVLGLPNTYYEYWYFPNIIPKLKIVEFFGRPNKLMKNKSREEEEDKVRWMRRMRRDRFFKQCRKKVKKKKMRSEK